MYANYFRWLETEDAYFPYRDKPVGDSRNGTARKSCGKSLSRKRREDFRDVLRGEIAMQRKSLSGVGTTYLLALLAFGASAGCEKEATRPTAPQISSVTVEKQGDGIHV